MKRIIVVILLILLTGCDDGMECTPGTRVCEENVSRTCMYGKWVDVPCKDAAPVCDEARGCVSAKSHCGNGVIELTEMCDGDNLNGRRCGDVEPGMTGELKCNSACQLDISGCEKSANACGENGSQCSADAKSIEHCAGGFLSRISCNGGTCVMAEDGVPECRAGE